MSNVIHYLIENNWDIHYGVQAKTNPNDETIEVSDKKKNQNVKQAIGVQLRIISCSQLYTIQLYYLLI